MKLSDLKIGTRLGLNAAVVLLLMIVLTCLGVWRISQLNDYMANVYASGEKSNFADQIDGLSATNLEAFRAFINTGDPQKQKLLAAQIDQRSKRINEVLETLKKTIVSSEGKALLGDLIAKQDSYRVSRGKAEELAAKGDDASVRQAREITEKEVFPTANVFLDSVRKFAKFQDALASRAKEAADGMTASAVETMITISAIAVILGVVFSWVITRSIIRPIGRAVRIAETVANGDLTQRIAVESKDETGQLLQALRTMNTNLARTVTHIRSGADTISSASSQIAAGNANLSSRTEEQASSLEETAASMEEMASTVKQNADNARQANQLAVGASEVAERGGAVVGEVVDTMNAISASSNKISEIVSVIDGIAFQTNILALNAAVEAARAGEQGKGFAVVAGEVRTLAQRSANAAKEIKELIEDSVDKVNVGAGQVARAGTTMQEIVSSVKRVTDIMGEITSASNEQARGVDQVNVAVSQIDEVNQQNAALVEEAAAAASALQDQASELVRAVAAFKTDINQVVDITPSAHIGSAVLSGRPALSTSQPA